MKAKETISVTYEGDHWVCPCGNHTMTSGFDTCDVNGNPVEPFEGIWNGLYVCLKCGRIIDQDTYLVVSKTNDLSSF